MNDLELTELAANRDALKLAAYILRASTICPASRKFAQHVLEYLEAERNSTLKALKGSYTEAAIQGKLFIGGVDNFAAYSPETSFVDTPEGGDSEKN